MSSHNGRRSAVQRVEDLRLEAEALDLRLSLASFRTIAEVQGCSVATAHQRVNRAMSRLVPIEKAETVRQQETERLDALMGRLLQAAAGTALRDENGDVVQVDTDALAKLSTAYVRASDRKAKLNGLDVPVQHKVTVGSELDAEIEELMARLQGASSAGAAGEAHTVPMDTAQEADA